MKEKFVLSLDFLSTAGNTIKVTITRPIKNLSSDIVSKTMDQVIQQGTLNNVATKKSAEYITYSMEQVETH